jgi:Family of unknown function (DUF6230)
VVLLPTAVAATAVFAGIAQGAVSFNGTVPMNDTIEHVESDGPAIAPGTPDGSVALPARLPAVEPRGLCQSTTVDLPAVGAVATALRARHVRATDPVLEAHDLAGSLDLRQLFLGPGADPEGRTGYRAGRTVLEGVTIKAGSVTAGTFVIDGPGAAHGGEGCSSTPDGAGR